MPHTFGLLDTVQVPRDAIVRLLWDLKYLPQYPSASEAITLISDTDLAIAVKAYQEFNGLDADGVVGPQTTHLMTNPLRCGLPDMMAEVACQWPQKDVTYTSRMRLPGLTDEELTRAFDEACNQWNAVCGIRLRRVAEASANIVARSGTGRANNLDGRGGTLAWSYLPCGASPKTVLQQMYDTAENWSYTMAVAVICHEVGHAIGLSHLAAGNLLAPYYDPRITKPQSGDVKEAVRRYGEPDSSPPSNPPSSPPSGPTLPGLPKAELVIHIGGRKFVAKGEMREETA